MIPPGNSGELKPWHSAKQIESVVGKIGHRNKYPLLKDAGIFVELFVAYALPVRRR